MSEAPTLPDYLRPGLDIVFVGINPGAYSARVGKYFATPANRFWRALNRSGLVDADRELGPGDETWLMDAGIGFTDVVKRASGSASDLRAADLRRWAPLTREKLMDAAPAVVCFNGLMGYRWFMQYAEGARVKPELGEQPAPLGEQRRRSVAAACSSRPTRVRPTRRSRWTPSSAGTASSASCATA